MCYLGCAVWAHKDWVGELLPAGSRSADFLRLYSRRLTAAPPLPWDSLADDLPDGPPEQLSLF